MRLVTVLIIVALAISCSTCAAATYSATDLGADFWPIKLNDIGQIVGERFDSETGQRQGVLLDGGNATLITHPDADNVFVHGLNNFGQVVGSGREYVGRDHAFIWDTVGGWRFIEPPGVESSFATDINDAGQIVGHLFGEAAVWQPTGEILRLGHLGGFYSEAMAINDAGAVVGISGLDPRGFQQHAFVWRDNLIRDLEVHQTIATGYQEFASATDINITGTVVGGAVAYYEYTSHLEAPSYGFVSTASDGLKLLLQTHLFAINDRNQAVGERFVADPQYGPDIWGAVLFENGQTHDLNDLAIASDFYLARAVDINEQGQILVQGWRKSTSPDRSVLHGILLTPVPEPTVAELALGAIVAVWLRSNSRLGRGTGQFSGSARV